MKIVVISPEQADPREREVLGELLAAGLERYHVRKPAWSSEQLEGWLRALPSAWFARIVLHQHQELADALGLGGRHWRDDGAAPNAPARNGKITSRSCHEVAALRASLGGYDSVFFGPVFFSVSKPGYGPRGGVSQEEVSLLLANRTGAERRTNVLALGGITAETAPRALALGFDGVAVLGAIWQAVDPLAAFTEIQTSLTCHVA